MKPAKKCVHRPDFGCAVCGAGILADTEDWPAPLCPRHAPEDFLTFVVELRRGIFFPALTHKQVELLDALPYDYPSAPATTKEKRLARELLKLGLLERCALSAPPVYHCTGLGANVVQAYLRKGWLKK